MKKVVVLQKCFRFSNNPLLCGLSPNPKDSLFLIVVPEVDERVSELKAKWLQENIGAFANQLKELQFSVQMVSVNTTNLKANICSALKSDCEFVAAPIFAEILPGTEEQTLRNELSDFAKSNNRHITFLNCGYLFRKNEMSKSNHKHATFTPWKLSLQIPNNFPVVSYDTHFASLFSNAKENDFGIKFWKSYLQNENEYVLKYKETRNSFISNAGNFTQLAPLLSNGFLSVTKVWNDLNHVMDSNDSKEGPRWIQQELLWREFFGQKLFYLQNDFFGDFDMEKIAKVTPLNSKEVFEDWKKGLVGHPLVRAGMKELYSTGFVSNRMRQILASHFIYDLKLPWQWGAQWFETCLLDFCPASNYGNWRYIHGSKFDPRGGREFNIEKQDKQFDAGGAYKQIWL
jgi:deoxyribodipyrimidine photolyase